jgi:hypothetical protein
VTLPEDGWDAGWSAFLLRDSVWVVRFEYEARKRHQMAEWEVDLKTRTIVSRNRLATELAFVEPGRRRRPGPPPPIAGGLLTRAAPRVEPPKPPKAAAVEEEAPAPAKKKAPARKKAVAKKLPATRRKVPLKPAPAPVRSRRR